MSGCPSWKNRPKSAFFAFFCPLSPFSGGCEEHLGIQKTEEKWPFPQISSDLLKPPSLKPPFAALQGGQKPTERTDRDPCRSAMVKFYTPHSADEICEHLSHTYPCEFGCGFCCEFCDGFSRSFEPSKKGYNGPEKFAPKFAQDIALKFTPPRDRIRTGLALNYAGANEMTYIHENSRLFLVGQ